MEILRQRLGVIYVVFIHSLEHILGPGFLALGDGISVDTLEHEGPKLFQGIVHRRGQHHGAGLPGGEDGIDDQGIDSLGMVMPQDIGYGIRDVPVGQEPRPDGIVNVMVYVGDLVGAANHHALQSLRPGFAGMAEDAVSDLIGKIQSLSVIFQHIHHPKRLLIVAEGSSQATGQGHFTGMAEGGVAQIVTHGDGFRQIFIQSQSPGDGGSDSRHLQSMGHAGTVMVTFRPQKYLGLVHQAAEGFGMDDPVDIPLIAGTHILLPVLITKGTAPALVGKGRKGVQLSMLLTLQFFTDGHETTPLYLSQIGNALYSWPVSMPSTVPAVISVILSRKGCT